jgi:Fe-S-cluster containining protein
MSDEALDVRRWPAMDWPVREARTARGRGDCAVCRGRCCTYVTVEIARPADRVDRDEVRWFLAHENIQVFIEDGEWYVQFYTPCRHLTADGRCAIYAGRFDVCREHSTRECEMSVGKVDAVVFSTTEEFDRWWDRRKQEKKDRRRRRKDRQE